MPAVRVPDDTYRIMRELAGGGSLQDVLTQAVEDLRRRRLLDEANSAFAAMRGDPSAWAREQEERELWDKTLNDGLEDD